MKTLTLDNKNWQLGTSSDDESDFAGISALSPDFKGQNYYQSKGDALAGQPALANLSGYTMNYPVFLGLIDPAAIGASSPRDTLLVTQGGEYLYTYNNTVTNFINDTVDSGQYFKGRGDIKYFKGMFYISKGNNIVRISEDLGYDFTWWTRTIPTGAGQTALNTLYPHPMEVVEDTLFIADGNKINTWDGTTAVTAQFSLPTGFVITALKVHTDGRYLKIFATDSFDYTHAKKATSKMYLMDTNTYEYTNSYDLGEQVEGAINFGGYCLLTYGSTLGYFDGNGEKLICPIADTCWSPFLFIFKNSVIIPFSKYITAYGDTSGKGNISFFPFNLQPSMGDELFFMMPLSYSNCLIQYHKYVLGVPTIYLAKLDFSTSPDINAQTTKINPGGRVWMRRLDIYFDALTPGASIDIYNRQTDGSIVSIGNVSYATDGAANKKSIFCNILTDFIQPYLSGSSAPLIKKINIEYESAE
jgi:hypothetical protein